MAKVKCTGCGVDLNTHCESKGCHWWRCENRLCTSHIFDLEHGVMTTLNGNVERLGAPGPDAA